MNSKPLLFVVYAALGAALAVVGYWLLFTRFMVYDDEGYVLWSLRMFTDGGGLYARVFSQYGPFFYFYYEVLHRLFGFPFDNVSGRLITLCYWLVVAGISAGLTQRITRSHVAALAAAVLTFVGLDGAMIGEPIHPGGLITLIAMIGAGGTALGILRGRPQLFAISAGIAGAALALIKINVGAFFIIAAASWIVLSAGQKRRSIAWLLALGCAAVPMLLMRALWPMPAITKFALIFACGSLALIPAMQASIEPTRLRSYLGFVVAGVGVAALTVIYIVARGTGLSALWNGVIAAPLRHPTVYFFAPAWQPGAAELAVALFVAAIAIRDRVLSPRARMLLAVARLVAGACYLSGAFTAETEIMTRFAFNRGLALAWLMTFPLGDPKAPANQARLWLGWLFVWQTLHAYPVAGSQVGWGTFLWPTLAATGIAEAFEFLAKLGMRRAEGGGQRGAGQWWQCWGNGLVLAAGLMGLWKVGAVGRDYYVNSPPLHFQGAAGIRPPPDFSRQLEVVQANIRQHASVLFTFPGMFSQNIWSGRPTPTAANVTHWFSLLSNAEQQAIIDRLEADPRSVLLVHRYLIDYLLKDGFTIGGPLRDYLDRAFEPAFKVGYFELEVRKGRTIAALSTARFVPPSAAGEPARIEVILGPESGQPIAQVAVRPLYNPAQTLMTLGSASWTIQPLTPDGADDGEASALSHTSPINRIVRLTIPIPPSTPIPRLAETCLVFLDANGEEVGTACFTH